MRPAATVFICVFALARISAADDVELLAPNSAAVGASIEVSWTGLSGPKDFITIIEKSSKKKYGDYAYTRKGSPVTLIVPGTPGEYEIRYLSAESVIVATLPLVATDVTAEVNAPTEVGAGSTFDVEWVGPGYAKDWVTLIDPSAKDAKTGKSFQYTKKGPKLELLAPDVAGEYEIRYLLGTAKRVLARRKIQVLPTSATLKAPESVTAGTAFEVEWEGPGNDRDYVTLVAVGTPERKTGKTYAYTRKGKTLELTAPEVAGPYEVRYVTGGQRLTLASVPVIVGSASAELRSPEEAEVGSVVTVGWTGPAGAGDYVVILPVGAENKTSGPFAHVRRGPELRIDAPSEPGDYEIRYVTRNLRATLAMNPLEVLPSTIPGTLRVVGAVSSPAPNTSGEPAPPKHAVAIILDASGSMLKKLDGRRRIEIAKDAVTKLATDVLPDNAPFALRVFGHSADDSCRTTLEVPLGPLDRSALAAKLGKIQAVNGAKTPIAQSLAKVGEDLAGAEGERVVVLVTDGEETCDGDPKDAIEKLAASGVDVRVSIVGFAIDEAMLRETFEEWARLGGGRYFDARDSKALESSMESATRVSADTGFDVLDADEKVVGSGIVGGSPIKLRPGTYVLRERGGAKRTRADVRIVSEKLQTTSF